MGARPGWLWLCVLSVGCQSVAPLAAAEAPPAGAAAEQLWRQGREAMRQGRPAEAIRYYEQSLAADGARARNHLSLAAAYLEKGDEAAAAPHLAQYLATFPEHHVVRAHYAELLLRLHRPGEARRQFERFIADTQDVPELASKYLIHCHSRLMEIAQAEGDEYDEHLHRGIGLYLLACERAELPYPDEGELTVEGVLCRAAGELTMARMRRRDEARPCWYLYEVWSRLAQPRPALRHLREADAAAPFSYLTPAEKRDLHLACLGCETDARFGR
jgi:tetratricopeptide (TPR) repeat protein